MFIAALQHLYREYRFQRADFTDLRRAFEHVSGRDLQAFFRQWVERRGSPVLQLKAVEVSPVEGEGSRIWGQLRQIQAGAPYRLQVPLIILTEQGQIVEKRLAMQGRSLGWEVSLKKVPQKVVDPRFDLFRRLHSEEMPPTLDSLVSANPLWLIPPQPSARRFTERL